MMMTRRVLLLLLLSLLSLMQLQRVLRELRVLRVLRVALHVAPVVGDIVGDAGRCWRTSTSPC